MATYNELGVPQLNLSNSSKEYVEGVHAKALAAHEDPEVDATDHFLVGAGVVVHCPEHKFDGVPEAGRDWVAFSIGGSTLDEALKDVIGGYDQGHAHGGDHTSKPEWVASTHEDLARLLAEHYECEVRDIYEVTS